MPSPENPASRYADQLLALYRKTPGTCGHVRCADRRLAAALRARGVPLETVQTALLLASARRVFRPATATPLPPIGSLHYFLPVIDELLVSAPDPTYLDHLRRRMAPLAPELVTFPYHQLP
jgi:hypothetical protein